MKTLYLVRHGKASTGNPALPDRDRPLNERGLRDAATMGQRLAQRGVKPDVVLSSPAARALATAEGLAKALGIQRKDIVVDDRLYNAAPDDLIVVIEQLSDDAEHVVLVGHNPGLTELANYFSSEIADMPTCAIAEFSFAAPSWADIRQASPAQVVFDQPGLKAPRRR
jgi:phosphohistidine phosphatase